jgi:hypothetical protein
MTEWLAVRYRGVNYDTGVRYTPEYLSLEVWDESSVRRDMQVIADDLNCNSVMILGTDPERLFRTSSIAIEAGLHVWLQPRLFDAGRQDTLSHLREIAESAETLRAEGGIVTLVVGCELTIFTNGLMPGRTWGSRAKLLTVLWPFLPVFNSRLDRYLAMVLSVVRPVFRGPVTYAAGSWERVDWRAFDVIGVNLYRDRSNRLGYRETLRGLRRHGKPVVITEFGCCTYEGAQAKGGGGHTIIDWRKVPPVLKGNPKKSERAQADLLVELIDLYQEEQIDGAFVYAFSEPSNPFSSSPSHDLDTASYGIVRVLPDVEGEPPRWEPKAAFSAVAQRYGDIPPEH